MMPFGSGAGAGAAAGMLSAPVRFDLVCANLPYIRTGDLAGLPPPVRFEPPEALDGGPDGLAAYRALAPALVRLLSPGGRALLEIGAGRAGEVVAVLAQSGLDVIKQALDLAGIPRVLIAGRRG